MCSLGFVVFLLRFGERLADSCWCESYSFHATLKKDPLSEGSFDEWRELDGESFFGWMFEGVCVRSGLTCSDNSRVSFPLSIVGRRVGSSFRRERIVTKRPTFNLDCNCA